MESRAAESVDSVRYQRRPRKCQYSLDHQILIPFLVAVVHSVVVGAVTYQTIKNKSYRTKALWKFSVADGIVFLLGLAMLSILGSFQSTLNLLTNILYIMIGSFVLSVEIPGYMFLSKYDERIVEDLSELRKNLVKTRYSFDRLKHLKTRVSTIQRSLSEVYLDELTQDFIISCERIQNIDRDFSTIVLSEITESIKKVSDRSKHPAPKLLDILSLAGLSFLIAQFLKLLG